MMEIQEFAKKLATETILDSRTAKDIVVEIHRSTGSIEKAEKVYEEKGYWGLMFYLGLLRIIGGTCGK